MSSDSRNLPCKPDFTQEFDRITAETFCQVYTNHPAFSKVLVVDCRTEREYNGGHIKGAIRCHPFTDSIPDLYTKEYQPDVLYIFHCEFSAFRAPTAIRQFIKSHADANRDRKTLHCYVLDGGFSEFWDPHKEFCDGTYVTEASGLIGLGGFWGGYRATMNWS
jgi:rhodanese-related sulfurtransferase